MACFAPPSATDMYSNLGLACGFGNVSRLEYCIKAGEKTTMKDKDGFSPIHKAAQNGDAEILSILIKNKANLRATTLSGQTALHIAVFYQNLTFVNELLSTAAKEDVNVKDLQFGMTPLHIAVNLGESDLVEVLLKAGGDKSVVDEQGYSAAKSCGFWVKSETSGLTSEGSKHRSTMNSLGKSK